MAVSWTVTIDCADPPTVAAFWKEALGYVDAPPPEGQEDMLDGRPDHVVMADPEGNEFCVV